MPYITTSRKAGPITRRLARSLSNVFSNCVYENRGKRNFDSVLSRASELGYPRIVLVHESHGNPSELQVVDVKGDTWDIAARIEFTTVKVEKIVKKSIVLVDKSAEKFAKMFTDYGQYEERESGEKGQTAKLFMDGNRVLVKVNEKEAIILKITAIHRPS